MLEAGAVILAQNYSYPSTLTAMGYPFIANDISSGSKGQE